MVLRDSTGFEWSRVDRLILNPVTFATSAWTPGEWADTSYGLRMPTGIPPGNYSIEVGVYDSATGAGRGASGREGRFLGTLVQAATVSVLPPSSLPTLTELQVPVELDSPAGSLKLLGLDPPEAQVLSGDRLSFFLFWETMESPDADYHARVTLTGSSGEYVFQSQQPLSAYPTSRWETGQRFKTHHFVHVSPTIPADDYHMTINLVDTDGITAWPTEQPLMSITVLHRERSFEIPSGIPLSLNYLFGDCIHLLGIGLEQTELYPGQAVQLTLYWQALGPARKNYSLYVHLLDSNQIIRGQVDQAPGSGMAPSTSWAPGQVIIDQISIPIDQDTQPGSYQLAIGFYDPEYGTRLLVTDSNTESHVGDQAVLPLQISVMGAAP